MVEKEPFAEEALSLRSERLRTTTSGDLTTVVQAYGEIMVCWAAKPLTSRSHGLRSISAWISSDVRL